MVIGKSSAEGYAEKLFSLMIDIIQLGLLCLFVFSLATNKECSDTHDFSMSSL